MALRPESSDRPGSADCGTPYLKDEQVGACGPERRASPAGAFSSLTRRPARYFIMTDSASSAPGSVQPLIMIPILILSVTRHKAIPKCRISTAIGLETDGIQRLWLENGEVPVMSLIDLSLNRSARPWTWSEPHYLLRRAQTLQK